MYTLYGSEQSKLMDTVSQEKFSISEETLMEDASFSAYLMLKNDIGKAKHTLFLAGGGNNGGDALAIARLAYLDGIRSISVLLADRGKETDLRAKQRRAVQRLGIEVSKEPFTCDAKFELNNADLIIDGLFGIGLKGEPSEPYNSLISHINSKKITVISLDVPSGMGDNVPFGKAINAYRTICMGEEKYALYLPQNRDFAGIIEKTFPFFPEAAKPFSGIKRIILSDMKIRDFKGSDYKKTRGSIAVIGGSGRFTGAVVLAAKAAFHSGVGLVTIFTEEKLIPVISKAVTSAMVAGYGDADDLGKFDAVLCGPGMGKDHDDMLSLALKQAKKIVLDADGIRAFARLKAMGEGKCILTPHLGEYSALLKAFLPEEKTDTPQAWLNTLKKLQKTVNAVIAVKAGTVWLEDGQQSLVYDGQNPSLGVAGSGDVLSGIITALAAVSKPVDLENTLGVAVKNGVLIHQTAGRLACEEKTFYSAEELIQYIGKSIRTGNK
ncbi:MAG: NAD(P)H-hydrate dehydratase [Sphaerochaeta sp.]